MAMRLRSGQSAQAESYPVLTRWHLPVLPSTLLAWAPHPPDMEGQGPAWPPREEDAAVMAAGPH